MRGKLNINILKGLLILLSVFCLISVSYGASKKSSAKKRLLVVSSYHREYVSSQESQKGFCDAMLKFGYFDSKEQAEEYTKNDYVETSKAIVKKLWMDAKRKSSKAEKEKISLNIYKVARKFKPDLIFLGDDDAADYIGQKFLDADVPLVFWGVNNTPVKYGLVDSIAKPGHNVTGVYESGYYIESLQLLKTLAPHVKTIAVLSDETVSGRTHCKALEYLARKGELPVKLKEIATTSSYEVWKAKALEFQKEVDAFYIIHFAGLKDEQGKAVSAQDVAKWYVSNIKIPETTRGHYVEIGLLCAADDSKYKQAFEAVAIAHDILAKGKNPATYPPRALQRGALIVNKQRAEMLGIRITKEMGIEEIIE